MPMGMFSGELRAITLAELCGVACLQDRCGANAKGGCGIRTRPNGENLLEFRHHANRNDTASAGESCVGGSGEFEYLMEISETLHHNT